MPINNVVLVLDGFMLPQGLFELNNRFLAAMSAFVFDMTGYRVRLIEKPKDDISGCSA